MKTEPNNSEEKNETPKRLSGWMLLGAFFAFFFLSGTFTDFFGLEGVLLLPGLIFAFGVSYLPVIFVPWEYSKKHNIVIPLLGLSKRDLIRTLPISIIAFILPAASQCAMIWGYPLPNLPDWDIYVMIAAIILLALLLPSLDLKVSRRFNFTSGLIVLATWSIFSYFMPMGDEELSLSIASSAENPINFLFLVIFIGFWAPICEEYFFRGYVFEYFLGRYNDDFAIFITSTLFGLAHFTATSSVSLVLFAIPLAMMTMRTKTIIPAIFAHMGLNLSALFIIWLSNQTG